MMRRLIGSRSGASATEFSIIAPVMAMMALGMIDGWSVASATLNMRAAVQAGEKYLIQGGTHEQSAQAIAMAAWSNAPVDGQITVAKECTCDGAAASCAGLCLTNSKPPVTTFSIQATGTWTAPFDTNFLTLSRSLTQSQVVRVR